MTLLTPNNYVVAVIDNKNYLIDTGSPVSFSYDDTSHMTIDNKVFDLYNNSPCPKKLVNRETGINIDGFVGADIIKKTGLTIDFENQNIYFDSLHTNECKLMTFNVSAGICFLDSCFLEGVALDRIVLDTGAKMPYVTSRYLNILRPTGKKYVDISPFFGNMSGEIYIGEFSVYDDVCCENAAFGVMPKLLSYQFDLITGPSLLTNKYFAMNFRTKTIEYK